MPIEASSLTDSGQLRPTHSNYVHHQSHQNLRNGQQICSNLLENNQNDNKNRGRLRWIVSLGLLLPALAAIIGVVAWAISAEVVMGAKRDAARKNNEISTMRLHQAFDNSDDFSINRVNKRIGDSSKSLVSSSETALMREVHEEEQTNKILNNELTPNNRIYSEDDNEKDDTYILDGIEDNDEGEGELPEEEDVKNFPTTKKPVSTTLDFEKIRKTLTGTHVAQVIDRLVAQRKVLNPKEANVPQIVVVAPVAEPSPKKIKTTSTTSTTPATTSSMSTTTTTTTTRKSLIRHTTLKSFRPQIQSMSLKLSNNEITTTRPKRTRIRTSSIKLKKPVVTTSTTTPSTTTTSLKTTKKSSVAKQRSRSRKTSSKSSKSSSKTTKTTTTTTPIPTTTKTDTLKSKIRQKELEFILDKVERLEKQQENLLQQSKDHDLLMDSSVREVSRSQVIPSKQSGNYELIRDFNYGYLPPHNYDSTNSYHHQNNNQMQSNGWQPSQSRPFVAPHPPPPPPPPPPTPPSQPHPAMFYDSPPIHSSPNNLPHNQMLGSHQIMSAPNNGMQFNNGPQLPFTSPPLSPSQSIREKPNIASIIKNRFKLGNLFNGVLPVPNKGAPNEPNNRAIRLNIGESQVPQESHAMPSYQLERGHTSHGDHPGVQLNFGGGPMGGGGQLMTSPMGIFKTLILPLMPKPRMNLNGKVVFGVVLENGVGFGKKPKILAQHFSTGRI